MTFIKLHSFYKPLDPVHIYQYNNVNHDRFTATFDPGFYVSYMVNFPE